MSDSMFRDIGDLAEELQGAAPTTASAPAPAEAGGGAEVSPGAVAGGASVDPAAPVLPEDDGVLDDYDSAEEVQEQGEPEHFVMNQVGGRSRRGGAWGAAEGAARL
jgi:hypothetical protein